MSDKYKQLELIKSFSSYIDTIINKGIMNDSYTLDRLEQFIKNYNIIIPKYNEDEDDDMQPDFIQSSEDSTSSDDSNDS